MTGKILAVIIVLSALAAGVSMYYLQVYGYYKEVVPDPGHDVVLLSKEGHTSVPIPYSDFTAIDADSSPIRYRACFKTDQAVADLTTQYQVSETTEPRNAPGWFDCFDATAIGQALESGRATAFTSIKNIDFGVDRIVAIMDDGHGYVWHELNNCGEKAYDGTVVGEECPAHPLQQN